jgi:predicted component of type VI protein secretion system
MDRPLRGARADRSMPPLNVDRRSQIDSHVVERVISVFEPRLKPLRARRELALRDIGIGHGFY